MNAGTKKNFADALDHVEGLFPNMAVLSQLSQKLKDPNTELDDLRRLISTEPALVADVIRISNSSFYSASVPCSDIGTALSRIGFNEVLRVVGLILGRDLCSRDLTKYGLTSDEFWAESVTVSLLMGGLAQAVGLDAATASTIGILHGIGRPVINNILEDFRIDIFWDSFIPIDEWERSVVGMTSGTAGARLLKRWNFPSETVYVIAYHVDPSRAPKRIPMLEVLHYALRLLAASKSGCFERNYVVPIYPAFTARFGLEADRIRAIVDDARDAFTETAQAIFEG